MRILLVEDDEDHCREYEDYVKGQGRIVTLRIAHGCSDGLSLLKSFAPDTVILDLMLHKGDGTGLEFIKKCREMDLNIFPHIAVITDVQLKQTHKKALELGAGFVFLKSELDYCPKKVIDYSLNYFDDSSSKDRKNNDKTIKLFLIEVMDNIGITYDMDGREYLIDAILLSKELKKVNLQHYVYPVLAKKYGKSEQSIRKAIENALSYAWDNTDINILKKYYSPQTSYFSGKPTNKQFICYYAYKLKA